MKKIAHYTWSFFLFIMIGTACGKTTKGKIAEEWNVVAYSHDEVQKFKDNSCFGKSFVVDESTVTETNSYTPPGGTIQSSVISGVVHQHTLTIEKKGTWKRVYDITYVDGRHVVTEITGTWAFSGKNKEEDFKRNERVTFNVLHEERTITNPGAYSGQEVVTETYLSGEEVMVFTVAESTRKELTLITENAHVSNISAVGQTLANVSMSKYVLKKP